MKSFWIPKIAMSYLTDKKQEKWISVSGLLTSIGLSLGVATLIIIVSVMQGFKNTMLDKILNVQGHISITGSLNNEAENFLKENKKIKNYFQILNQKFVTKIQSSTDMSGIIAQGVTQPYSDQYLSKTIVKGESLRESGNKEDNDGILVGKKFAADNNIDIGDDVTLISNQMIITPFGETNKENTFKVKGIFSLGINHYDTYLSYISINSMKDFFSEELANQYVVFLKNPEDSIEIAKEINGKTNLQAQEWQENNSMFTQVLTVQRNVMFIVISLMIIIASFNGISSLLILVKEKSKEIAILRVLGAKKSDIIKIFLTIGSVLSIFSIAIGIVLGLLVSANIDQIRLLIENTFNTQLFPPEFYQLTKIPISISWFQIFMIGLWALLLILLSILYPCIKASQIEPDKELRV